MSEFGHFYATGPGIHMDIWGAGPFVIEVAGKSYRFEDSDRFGPSLLRKDGELKAHPWPPERSPFWHAHGCWVQQGRRMAKDGVQCLWDDEPPAS